ncbi:MAG: hypothetical protein H6713_06155 [Myxococcales bacterium]|nr:hypothetical protein [Myxococcales bacterium]
MLTAANPVILHGGLTGESKWALDQRLRAGGAELLPRTTLLPVREPAEDRLRQARAFMAREGLTFPVVLKPDVGLRGLGVLVARDDDALARRVRETALDLLLQEYVGGREYGVYYVRRPEWPNGQVPSICAKVPLTLTGDGVTTLERLILDDHRAVSMAPVFLRRFRARLQDVPAPGERVTLVEIHAHSLGALFLDRPDLRAPALTRAIDHVSQATGLYIGRYDVRARSELALKSGEFKIIEFNGVTGEPGDMYDPRRSLWSGWRRMAAHWRDAYEIGAANRERGASISGLRDVASQLRRDREHGARLRREMGDAESL